MYMYIVYEGVVHSMLSEDNLYISLALQSAAIPDGLADGSA